MADVDVTFKLCDGRAELVDRYAQFAGELCMVVGASYEFDQDTGRGATYVTMRVPERLLPAPQPVRASLSVVYGKGAVKEGLCR